MRTKSSIYLEIESKISLDLMMFYVLVTVRGLISKANIISIMCGIKKKCKHLELYPLAKNCMSNVF